MCFGKGSLSKTYSTILSRVKNMSKNTCVNHIVLFSLVSEFQTSIFQTDLFEKKINNETIMSAFFPRKKSKYLVKIFRNCWAVYSYFLLICKSILVFVYQRLKSFWKIVFDRKFRRWTWELGLEIWIWIGKKFISFIRLQNHVLSFFSSKCWMNILLFFSVLFHGWLKTFILTRVPFRTTFWGN